MQSDNQVVDWYCETIGSLANLFQYYLDFNQTIKEGRSLIVASGQLVGTVTSE